MLADDSLFDMASNTAPAAIAAGIVGRTLATRRTDARRFMAANYRSHSALYQCRSISYAASFIDDVAVVPCRVTVAALQISMHDYLLRR